VSLVVSSGRRVSHDRPGIGRYVYSLLTIGGGDPVCRCSSPPLNAGAVRDVAGAGGRESDHSNPKSSGFYAEIDALYGKIWSGALHHRPV